jgi:hypothetical protein
VIAAALIMIAFVGEAPVVEEQVEKKVIYQKETTVDLSGSTVEADTQSPPAFFLSKVQTPQAKGLLEERLKFSLRDYNMLGF